MWLETTAFRRETSGMGKRDTFGLLAFATAALAASPGMTAEASLICTNAGNQYHVGDFACLPACHGRQRYARCDAVADTATWTYVSDVCPMALLSPAEPPGVSFAPILTAMSPIPYDIPMSAIAADIAERIAGLKVRRGSPEGTGTTLASR